MRIYNSYMHLPFLLDNYSACQYTIRGGSSSEGKGDSVTLLYGKQGKHCKPTSSSPLKLNICVNCQINVRTSEVQTHKNSVQRTFVMEISKVPLYFKHVNYCPDNLGAVSSPTVSSSILKYHVLDWQYGLN